MNKLLALGFSALLCCVPGLFFWSICIQHTLCGAVFVVTEHSLHAEALRCTVCQKKIPVFGCIKGLGICHSAPGLPCKYIRVFTAGIQFSSQADWAMQGDRCNIMEPTKSGHRLISCCNTDFCNN